MAGLAKLEQWQRPTPHRDPIDIDSEAVMAVLRREGHINEADCVWARSRGEQVGVTAPHVLLTWAKVNRIQLWQARCEVWRIPFVDVRTDRPDPVLVHAAGLDACLRNGFVPHSLMGETVVVATSVRPTLARATNALRSLHTEFPETKVVKWIGCSDLDIDLMLLSACREDVAWDAADRLTEEHPNETAATGPAPWNYPVLWTLLAGFSVALALRPMATLTIITVFMSMCFSAAILFKSAAVLVGGRAMRRKETSMLEALLVENGRRDPVSARRRSRSKQAPTQLPRYVPDHELPTYTILVPAYKEEAVIGKLIENVEGLDYPPEKLDVLVLLEEDDTGTLAAAKAARPPGYVRLFVTPDGKPKTKPRACNAGLRFAHGEYLVIYDAEDRPEPSQLRDALAVFESSDDRTAVVQGRLNYFNAKSNLLTRMFALEYAAWFDCMLPGLDALGLPIPLGGTSNHFVTSALRELGGWDAHNVTEDADLGLRASARGMRVAVVDSTTWEEACSEWKAWIKQRTRWIKGYMVTALVHTRHPIESYRRLGIRGTLGLLLLVAGTPLTFLALPIAWLLAGTLYVISTVTHQVVLPSWALRAAMLNLTVGYVSAIATSVIAMVRRRAWWLAPFAFLNPFYWCMHSISAYRAAHQLFFSPSVWEKTPHGIDPKAHHGASGAAH